MLRLSTNVAAELANNCSALGRAIVVPLMFPVPDVAPRVYVVAAPPILSVVALVLKILPVVEVVVISPPFTAISPEVVTLPPKVVAPVPRNEYVGLVFVFPKDMFSEPLVVFMFM